MYHTNLTETLAYNALFYTTVYFIKNSNGHNKTLIGPT